jgi:quercetin dioxygenase-like cupin family protein
MHDTIIQTDSQQFTMKEWGRIADIIDERTAKGEREYSFSLIEYNKPHFSGSHDDTEIIFVISGRGKIKLDEKILEIRPGSLITIPRSVVHGIVEVEENSIKAILIHVA